jgi:hypothetical protein
MGHHAIIGSQPIRHGLILPEEDLQHFQVSEKRLQRAERF